MTLIAWAAEAVHESESAAGGLAALGLDWKALLFQVVNFAILLWLLKRFAYRPIVKLLEARRQKIEESLKTADAIAAEKASLDEEREARLAEAEQEAARIIAASKQESSRVLQVAQARGREQVESLRAEAQNALAQERRRIYTDLQAETLQLVRKAAERILRKKLDTEADARLMKEAIQEVKTS
ncbi:MAG: F0F1 ATP synthase subunit B [Patescibacteria group bacterium]|mgnify:CR=1 FL=1